MKFRSGLIALFLLSLVGGTRLAAQEGGSSITLRFAGTEYLHRWAKAGQHAFTPRGQEDEELWTDMVTVNYYASAPNAAGLSAKANAVLASYKKNDAKVLKATAVPATATKPAEYLLVVALTRPDCIETAFARFAMVDKVGLSVVYFHREYGAQDGDLMNAWLQKNEPATEKALLGMKNIPLLDVAKD